MSASESSDAEWPARFRELCLVLRNPPDGHSRDGARGRLWLLLNSLLSQYLRFHIARQGRVAQEDLEDIAAEKSLDLLRKIELGGWNAAACRTSEITGFLSKVARNGLVDRLREIGRRIEPAGEDDPEWTLDAVSQSPRARLIVSQDPPDTQVERGEFVAALRGCTEEMECRSRLVWFFRVMCGMSSEETAAHPQISLKAPHVDVILHRARRFIQTCLRQKGYEPCDMPQGTFAELWKVCELDEVRERSGAAT